MPPLGVPVTAPPSYASFEQGPGVLQIRGIEPLGEPAIDRREQVGRLGPLALIHP
jgi:hypothetical protein